MGAYSSTPKRIEKDDILDEIADASQAMRRRAWQCDACGDVTNSDVPIQPPAPCRRSGNISLEAMSDG